MPNCPKCACPDPTGHPSRADILTRLATLEQKVEHLTALIAPAPCPPIDDPSFDVFWNLYPRKVGKSAAASAWRHLPVSERQRAAEAVKVFAAIWAQADEARTSFIRHPATWLRGRAWEDGEAEWRRVAHVTNGNGHHPSAPQRPAPRDIDAAPADIQDIARRIARREPTTDTEDERYYRWREGHDEP